MENLISIKRTYNQHTLLVPYDVGLRMSKLTFIDRVLLGSLLLVGTACNLLWALGLTYPFTAIGVIVFILFQLALVFIYQNTKKFYLYVGRLDARDKFKKLNKDEQRQFLIDHAVESDYIVLDKPRRPL